MELTHDRFEPDPFEPTGAQPGRVVFSVGLPIPVALSIAGPRHLRHVAPHDLAAACHAVGGQVTVACPLFLGKMDALCVIGMLEAAGFEGMLLVIAPHVPDQRMIERELRAAARGISVRLLAL